MTQNVELARGYVSIFPAVDGKGIETGVKRIFDDATDAGERTSGKMGSGIGKNLLGGINRAVNIGVGAIATTVGGVLTASLAKGFNRLTGIENATAKLSGLGHSAEAVSGIMANALDAVRGTSFAMDEAASAAATAVAAGIKPGKELEAYLKSVGDTAAITGASMAEIGSIFGKVMTSGKAQRDVLNQLADRGFPIFTELQKVLGVTSDELDRLIRTGGVTSDVFLQAFDGIKGAALESGNTTAGAMKNASAAMGRFGAVLLQDIYPALQPLFVAVIDLFDRMTAESGTISEILGGTVADSIGKIAETINQIDAASLAASLGTVFGGMLQILVLLLPMLLNLSVWVSENAVAVGIAVVAWKGMMALSTLLPLVQGLGVAFRILGAAMLTNPIGLIITGIVALIAAIALLIMNWDAVTLAIQNFVTDATAWLDGFFGDVERNLNWLANNWDTVVADMGAGWNNFIEGIKSGMGSAVNWVIDRVNSLIGVINAALNLLSSMTNGVINLGPIGKIANIPAMAEGGRIASSGSALVGEAGIEVVTGPKVMDLTRGAQVTPLDRVTEKLGLGSSRGGDTITIVNSIAERGSQSLARLRAKRDGDDMMT